ncbi:MAG: hypothetical protein IKS45_02615 [Thermoguttaceae bacterium]|nr:hypothetical protein [Thermoguttaceae bacterium]
MTDDNSVILTNSDMYRDIISIVKYRQKSSNPGAVFSVIFNTWSESFTNLDERKKAFFICDLLESISRTINFSRLTLRMESGDSAVDLASFSQLREFYIAELSENKDDPDYFVEFPLAMEFFDSNGKTIVEEKTDFSAGGVMPFCDNYELKFQLKISNSDAAIESVIKAFGIATIREILDLPDEEDQSGSGFTKFLRSLRGLFSSRQPKDDI